MGTGGDGQRCPCGSGDTYGACCGPIHRGERRAPTAEALMRSRYSAFAVGDAAWLAASWHPSTRPADLGAVDDETVDDETADDQTVWRLLEVLATREGGPFDDAGQVEFVAHWRSVRTGERGRLHEVSRFVREGGQWFYLDGDVTG